MKRYLLLFLAIFNILIVLAQAPGKFNYQAVARNTSGNLIINQNISVRISIITGSPTGATEYSETHSVASDAFGVFNLLVGGGTPVSGSFGTITWGTASKFLKIEADITGGTTYQTLATTQILSVPYALYANTAGNGFSGDYNDLINKPAVTWNDGGSYIYAGNITSTSSVAVSDNGYLGIGTTNPAGELHINKPIGFSGITFNGTGVNDININYSSYNGSGDVSFIVEVNNTGPNPDLIRWSNNGGSSWTSDIPMASSGIALSNNVTIGFTVLDGHTYGDRWQFTVSEGFMNGLLVKDGKVGIATTSPAEKLDVNGTVRATAFSGNGAGLTGIASGTGGVVNTGTTTIGADTDADGVGIIAFQTRGTTKTVLNNTGSMGIGTETPTVKLDVIGSINSTAPDDSTDITLKMTGRNTALTGSAYNDSPGSGLFFQMQRAKGKKSVPSSVATNDLLGGIEAYGYDGSAFNLSSSINLLADATPKSGSVPGRIIFNTRSNNNTTGVNERMRITEAGKVGIGTMTPTELLDVNGNIKAVSFLGNGAGLTGIAAGTGGVVNSGSTTIGADTDKDGTGEIAFQIKEITRLTISNSGYLGIGTNNPEGLLQITADKNITLDSTLIFKNGNLGIGVINPAEKVEINGKLKATTIEGNSALVAGVNISDALIPVGAILPWAKSISGIPALSNNFVECNGQVLNDLSSPLNGQTIPNLNGYSAGTKRFLRGSTTSGTVGGSDTNDHSHTVTIPGEDTESGVGGTDGGKQGTFGTSGSSNTNNLPSYYEVVYIMRVK